MGAYGMAEFVADLKAAWRSWTVWFNTFVAVAVVALVDPQVRTLFETYLTPTQMKVVAAAVAVTNIVLRFKTQTALRDK